MNNILKSWKTTVVGVIAIAGLIYNIYLTGGLNVVSFLLLINGVGFMLVKDADKSHSTMIDGIGGELPKTDDE
jgi:hypothetical protein